MRVFLAIELPNEIKDSVGLFQAELREVLPKQGVRLVKPDRMHLTLVFLGEVAEADLSPLRSALEEIIRSAMPFEVELKSVGAFPNDRRPGVLWVGVDEPTGKLTDLQSRAAEAVVPYFEKEEARGYSPHITLARISPPSQKVGRTVAPVLRTAEEQSFGRFWVEEAALFESKGGEYRPLFRFGLSGESGT